MIYCHLLIIFKINFFRKIISGIRLVSNSLDAVRPDLGPNCLQRLSADDKGGL